MYLITGATGNVGRIVTQRLAAAGQPVRAITRNPDTANLPREVEVWRGDLADPPSIAPALRGVERLFLFPMPDTAAEVVAAARDAGVRRIVLLSSGAVTGGFDTDYHLPIEQAIEDSGVEWTHVRPGEFAINKLWLWGPSIRARREVRDPNPDVAWYPTHEADIADVAVAALREDGHAGQAYTFGGPELISHREQVAAIAAALGEPVEFIPVTAEEAREQYRAQGGFAADNADMLLGFADYGGEATDPEDHDAAVAEALASAPPQLTAAQVPGCQARDFAQWARDHVADFA